MTPLPSRLRASAQVMRTLDAVSLRPSSLALIDRGHAARIARELEEAAQALEAGPLDALLTQILNRRVTIEQRIQETS